MTLTADEKKTSASYYRGLADVLDPPASPPTTPPTTPPTEPPPPSGGGPVVDPSGFEGRTLGDPKVWKQTPSFQENFPTLAPRGKFLDIYKMWSAYPTNYNSTDKKGFYDPYNIEVVNLDGVNVMQSRVVSAKTNGTSRPSGSCPQARWGPQGDGRTKGERIQCRAKVVKAGPGAHWVPLGWPPNDHDWPRDGEPDYIEIDPTSLDATISGWFHVQNGGSSGEGQVRLSSNIRCGDWFVLTAERIAGKSYRWYINGKLFKQILAPGQKPIASEEAVTTVLSGNYNIPLNYLRWPLQFESKGTGQTNDVIVAYDHWSIWEPV